MTANANDRLDPKNLSLLWIEPEAAAEIAAMHAGLFDPPWSEASLRNLLGSPGATALVARVRLHPDNPTAAAGFIIGRVAADEAEILTLGVCAPFQRCGIARHLVEGLIRAVRSAGGSRLHLEVAADNAPALALYRGLGFAEAGRRRGYYQRSDGTSCDAFTLTRCL